MAKQVIAPTKLEKAVGYAHAFRCGKTVYTSGQIAHDASGKLVGQGDARAPGEQVYQNIKGILESCGGTMDSVVRITTYVASVAYPPIMAEIRAKYFPKDPPASTFLVVASLADPAFLVEVDAIAVLDSDSPTDRI
jgi:enamine deaminase RidA (YjgF/YER057c/UK114 family)